MREEAHVDGARQRAVDVLATTERPAAIPLFHSLFVSKTPHTTSTHNGGGKETMLETRKRHGARAQDIVSNLFCSIVLPRGVLNIATAEGALPTMGNE